MKIFITGGTGFIGQALTKALLVDGHSISVLSRGGSSAVGEISRKISIIQGNSTEPGSWLEQVDGHDLILNLAGAPIFTRWNRKSKEIILDSRILTTHNLVRAISSVPKNNIRLINASAVGYYGFHRDTAVDESSSTGGDFLAVLAFQWERNAEEAQRFGSSVVFCRFGIVMGSGGGFWSRIYPLYRRGFGSRLGKGTQWFSWIHLVDLVDAVRFLIANPGINGPVNITAPNPVRNSELSENLNKRLKKHPLIPAVPEFLLKYLYGESAETLLGGQKVIPKRLTEAGFRFTYPTLDSAFQELIRSE